MKYIASFKDQNGKLRYGFWAQTKRGSAPECICCLIPNGWERRMPSVVEVAKLCR